MATLFERFKYLLRRLQWQLLPHEPETRFLRKKLDLGQIDVFVDAGANFGMYSYLIRRHAKNIVCFEPNIRRVTHLNTFLAGQSCQIEAKGLDERPRTATLRVPCRGGKQQADVGTISIANNLETEPHDEIAHFDIETVSLDSYFLPKPGVVGLIKIDVEGHETAIIRGGTSLIARDSPLFLIEAELRHSPYVEELFEILNNKGYSAYFLDRDDQLKPVSFAELSQLQSNEKLAIRMKNPLSRVYVNNFFFLPAGNPLSEQLLT